MSPHLSYLRQFLAVTAILILWSTALFAQVIIKEKITINPKGVTGKETNQLAPCSGGSLTSNFSGVVMTKKGNLLIGYDIAQRLGDGIPFVDPGIATLRSRRFRGSAAVADSFVSSYFNNLTATPRNDPLCNPQSINQYNYDQSGVPVQPFYNLFPVQEGDSVQFLYVTNFYPVNGVLDTLFLTSYDYDSTYHFWDIWFSSCDNCRGTWREMLKVTALLVDTTVSFMPPVSNAVYPRYPGQNNSTDKNDTLSLQVQTMFNGAPAKNVWVKVDTTVLADSGGHSHGGIRPLGTFLLPKPGGGYDSMRTFTRQTDTSGNLTFKYLASQFGGIERIKVVRLSDTTRFDTVQISTKVPALQLLPPQQNYSKTGGTCNHHGPRVDGLYPNCGTPDNNHWIDTSAFLKLDSAATAFMQDGRNRTGIMKLNDLGLPLGGLFDIDGTWLNPHVSHRTGKDIDIENSNLQVLKRNMSRFGWRYIFEGSGFYPHFRYER